MSKKTTMTTKTTKAKKTVASEVTSFNGNYPSLPKTLEVLQFLRTAKVANDAQIAKKLDEAYTECRKNSCVLVLERIMLHMGDVSRQHNLLTELGIQSATGGAQERKIFRSCMRWWEKNLPESFAKNLRVFTEFTLYENLMFYQNTTDRKTGKVLSTEILFPMPNTVHEFLASQIRAGKDLNLIAKHLPKISTGKSRTTKVKIKAQKDKTMFELKKIKLPKVEWLKINGELVTDLNISVKAGDVITYPRRKQSVTLAKQEFVNEWIYAFCKVIDWSTDQYKAFRTTQSTPEQAFSSKKALTIAKSDFVKMLDTLTTGQRFRVAKMIAYKDAAGKLQPKPKWEKLGQYYIEWETAQEKVADKLREAAATGNVEAKKELMKEFKVKATGLQTIDILAELFKGGMSDGQINNTYQALVEKMDLIANIFPIIDGSSSMNDTINHKNIRFSYFDVVCAMCVAFSTRNPVEEFRNTYGWFSREFIIAGRSKFVDERPNQYLSKAYYTKRVPDYAVLSPTKTFTENFKALKQANPGIVENTNMFASIEYFVELVKSGKCHVEDLPNALLYLTDNENNTGLSPKEAIRLANSIGWHPLLVFWGIKNLPQGFAEQIKNVPNVLVTSGFTESALSQILRGIKSGSINPETELWSVYEDKRYSVLQ